MEHITLPGTDLKVTPVCLGTWQFNNGITNNTWDAQTEELSKTIVDKAFQVGINFFDTAEAYPRSEGVLGKCLEGRRHNAVIATKYGFRSTGPSESYTAEAIDAAITTSLQSLKTNYIDIYQIHWPDMVADYTATVEELKRQVAKGRIHYYGVCNFGPKNMKSILEAGGQPISNQIGYNLLWRSIEHEVKPICMEKNISILAYSPLQQGLLSGKYLTPDSLPEGRRRGKLFSKSSTTMSRHGQDGHEKLLFETLGKLKEICTEADINMSVASLSWLLQQQNVRSIIVGARNPEQIEQNVNIVKLSQDVLKKMTEATDDLKQALGKTLDAWVTPDRCE
ncbi:aldo-keto reductase YdjG-like [Octopus vulgaris]|uniref:Aldo-keto reductase YdjG-like n=2 Tax=Octopus TaxID=6643 RepID=A0AA36F6N1_OCTVU|nr:NADH-specific methylglyoxal reductase [Octopus sinensis]CAI9727746.1 aldo-keto reductase YdjG-like [Octopus vulgaris]